MRPDYPPAPRGKLQRTSAVTSRAFWNPAGTHRYRLDRWFADGVGVAHFIMLNPSAATEDANDATVAKCERYTRAWGKQRLIITNLFAAVARHPFDLTRCFADPVGSENDQHILDAVADAHNATIVAWGDNGLLFNRARDVRRLLAGKPLYALRVNASGEPAHPIYLPATLEPIPYEAPYEL